MRKMKKQIIRLTENDLQQIIRNSVTKIIKENQESEFNFFSKGKPIEYVSPDSTSNYQKNYKEKRIDNCDGTYQDINNYQKNYKGNIVDNCDGSYQDINDYQKNVRESKLNEGWKNRLGSAALGATMAMSPLNTSAQQRGFVQPNQVEIAVDGQIQQYVTSEIKKNTIRNKQTIRAVENLMRQDESVADDIYSIALMDEYDNFITLGDNLSKDDYNTISQEMEREDLVTINFFDNGRRISNVIVPLERLETLLERY